MKIRLSNSAPLGYTQTLLIWKPYYPEALSRIKNNFRTNLQSIIQATFTGNRSVRINQVALYIIYLTTLCTVQLALLGDHPQVTGISLLPSEVLVPFI